jgi:chorismate dehydratase
LKKIRVGAVNYRNAKPLVFGLERPEMTNLIELSYDYPARLAQRLRLGQIDVGLLPVAAIPEIPEARVISKYGIGADGSVASVALFSQVPIQAIETVLLDYQSRTSVALLRILMRAHWEKQVHYRPSAGDDYIRQIEGSTAGLIIGDRALQHLDQFPYVYDLAEAWKCMTGMPFVFAAWISIAPLASAFINRFDNANAIGLGRLEELAAAWSLEGVDMLSYFRDRISYTLDDQKQQAMNKFLSMLDSEFTV